LALALLPAPRAATAVLTGACAGLLPLLAFPLRGLAALRAALPRRSARRGTMAALWSGRWADLLGSPSRLVAELALLTLAVASVLAVRRRGVAPAGSTVDLLLSAAPLLLAVAGAVLLARLFPVLLAPVVHWAGRRDGVIGFLGLARATQSGGSRGSGEADGGQPRRAPTVLPLLPLLLAVTTAGFGVTVLSSADAARQQAVRLTVGGDARVDAVGTDGLPPGFAEAAAKLPGVQSGTSVVVDGNASIGTADGSLISGALLLVVDPQGYAALTRRVGVGLFDPALLDTPQAGAGQSVPALVSTDIAGRLGSEENAVQLPDGYGNLHFKPVGTVTGSPAVPGGVRKPLIVVPSAGVLAQLPDTQPMVASAGTWFGTGGTISSSALQELVTRLARSRPADGGANGTAGGTAGGTPSPAAPAAAAGAGGDASLNSTFTVTTRADYARTLDANPLEHAADRMFWAAVAAAAGYSVLSLLLTLLRAAPERAALLARLRTMGLRPRQGLTLILVEALPQALVAAAAGAGLACLSAPLLGSAVDLSVMVGATVPGGLRTAAGPVLWQAAGLAVLSVAVVCGETVLFGRRQINSELRAGDQR
ncbi:FtsX-like permease family protein, partial [Kitasatospora nipponensis]|uniref:FtsX-like permease family protein n=1 Tax=Kitasatospora nipponensis TaxID=258049 RepID=UPI0031CE83FC